MTSMVPSPPHTTNMRIPCSRALWTTADRSQLGSTRKASGTSFQACIALITSISCTGDFAGCPRTGIKDQLGSHRAFFCG